MIAIALTAPVLRDVDRTQLTAQLGLAGINSFAARDAFLDLAEDDPVAWVLRVGDHSSGRS